MATKYAENEGDTASIKRIVSFNFGTKGRHKCYVNLKDFQKNIYSQ